MKSLPLENRTGKPGCVASAADGCPLRMTQHQGLLPLLIARQASAGGDPVYPQNLAGTKQAHAVRHLGRSLRAGIPCHWKLLLLAVGACATTAVVALLHSGMFAGAEITASASSSGTGGR